MNGGDGQSERLLAVDRATGRVKHLEDGQLRIAQAEIGNDGGFQLGRAVHVGLRSLVLVAHFVADCNSCDAFGAEGRVRSAHVLQRRFLARPVEGRLERYVAVGKRFEAVEVARAKDEMRARTRGATVRFAAGASRCFFLVQVDREEVAVSVSCVCPR